MDSMASRIGFGTVHWGKAGEETPRFEDGREEMRRGEEEWEEHTAGEGESGGGRRKARRVEGREKGKEPGKDEDETCLEK